MTAGDRALLTLVSLRHSSLSSHSSLSEFYSRATSRRSEFWLSSFVYFSLIFFLVDCATMVLVICQMCKQQGHEADACPWVYSLCPESDCDGIRMLITSHTSANPGRKYLKCQYGACKSGLKWLDEAIVDASRTTAVRSNECFKCGEIGHWVSSCPWLNLKCNARGCKATKTLKISSAPQSYGQRYLKCVACGNFQWLKDAKKEKEKEEKESQATITINMSLSEFCHRFEATSISKNSDEC